MVRVVRLLLLGAFFCLVCIHQAFAGEDPLSVIRSDDASFNEELKWLHEETSVITATRTLEDVKKSGSSVTVITDREIREMGARNLIDVLRTVPGIGVTRNNLGFFEIECRGIKTPFSEKVLFLIDSHPINNNLTNGGAVWTHDDFFIYNVKRIEVIRGPGSALYGANAFAAVINIITKDAKDIDGASVFAGGGSFATQQYSMLFGKTFNDLAVAANLNILDTDGFHGLVDQDFQSVMDRLTGSHASLAPGYTDLWKQVYDFNAKVNYKDFELQGDYIKKETGPFIGMGYALNDETRQKLDDYFLQLAYNREISRDLTLNAKLYRDFFDADNFWEVYPKGFVSISPDGTRNVFPDGFLGRSPAKNSQTGFELQANYTISDQNRLIVGTTFEDQEQFDIGQSTNFDPLTGAPLGSLQDITDRWNWNKSVERTIAAGYVQDIWDIRKDLRAIIGARYDSYDDFGGTFNPRMAIIWEFIKNYDLQLLYGSAFRAPTFGELYNRNNPALIGNPSLKPEKVKTYEIGVAGNITDHLSARVGGFYENIDDIIVPAVTSSAINVFENAGEFESRGVELEMKWRLPKGSYLAANYTYVNAKNKLSGDLLASVPAHRGNIMANFRLSRYLNFYADTYLQASTPRAKEDPRGDVPAYALVNTNLIVRNFLHNYKGLELRVAVFNLFDTKIVDPSPIYTMPSDYPTPGITLFTGVNYEF